MNREPARGGLPGRWRRWLFGISARELRFERRRFRASGAAVRERIETIGAAFATGYHAALEVAEPAGLGERLSGAAGETAGFAFEGAGMGLALRDWLTPGRRDRVSRFLRGAGDAHAYMVHVGAGWALARLPARVDRFLARFDPLLRWLILDGWGFHEGFFRAPRWRSGRPAPRRLVGYQRRAFDQGLGRCLWFMDGGAVDRVPESIGAFESRRHGDLWSGIGLAGAYSGLPLEPSDAMRLRAAAGGHAPALAQGAAFGAQARRRAGNPAPHTDLVCQALCGLRAEEAAAVTDRALEGLPGDGAEPAYEVWRQRIQERFAAVELAATGP